MLFVIIKIWMLRQEDLKYLKLSSQMSLIYNYLKA